MGKPKNVRTTNASAGLNMLFIAEMISIISIIFSIAVAGISTALGGTEPSALLGGIIVALGFAVSVALIVSFVMLLVGLAKAGKDKQGFKIAFWLIIGSIIAQIVSAAFLTVVPVAASIITIAVSVIQIVVVFYVISTTVSLLEDAKKHDVAKFGSKVWLIFFICLAISVVLAILANFGIFANATVASILSIGTSVLELVGYIMFVIFLKKASKALA